jgi:hypothetical protein
VASLNLRFSTVSCVNSGEQPLRAAGDRIGHGCGLPTRQVITEDEPAPIIRADARCGARLLSRILVGRALDVPRAAVRDGHHRSAEAPCQRGKCLQDGGPPEPPRAAPARRCGFDRASAPVAPLARRGHARVRHPGARRPPPRPLAAASSGVLPDDPEEPCLSAPPERSAGRPPVQVVRLRSRCWLPGLMRLPSDRRRSTWTSGRPWRVGKIEAGLFEGSMGQTRSSGLGSRLDPLTLAASSGL